MMFGKYMCMRTVLISVHIVNDQTGEEQVLNVESTSRAKTHMPRLDQEGTKQEGEDHVVNEE